jgi:V/A-type H+-transporting ATPase subunit I
MALGLATAFLGMVINQIAVMALGIPYGIGLVVFIAILVFGHTFNLVINCLSAFVHTLRLQYLEFFSKFFVGGGEPFKPFAEERQYTSIQLGLGDSTSQANR